MGKIYKNKKRACGLCKPHKRGWQDKKKPKERASIEEIDKEIAKLEKELEDLEE